MRECAVSSWHEVDYFGGSFVSPFFVSLLPLLFKRPWRLCMGFCPILCRYRIRSCSS